MRLPVQVTDLEGEVLDLKGQLTDLEAIRLDLEGHVQDLSEELQGAAAERTDKAKAVKVRVGPASCQAGQSIIGAFFSVCHCIYMQPFHHEKQLFFSSLVLALPAASASSSVFAQVGR